MEWLQLRRSEQLGMGEQWNSYSIKPLGGCCKSVLQMSSLKGQTALEKVLPPSLPFTDKKQSLKAGNTTMVVYQWPQKAFGNATVTA